MIMDNVKRVVLNHKSVRKYQDKEISQDLKNDLFSCAQMAASSSFFQAYSIIEVKDIRKREILFEISGNQKWVKQAPLVLLVCADNFRAKHYLNNIDSDYLSYTESLLVAVTDAALATQNLVICAESAGLGVAFVGGIRNDTEKIIESFNLPELVFPLYLLCIGYPDENNDIKPRFQPEIIIHTDTYDSKKYPYLMEEYNKTMARYYSTRTPGSSYNDWSLNSGKSLIAKPRKDVGSSIQKQGFITGIDLK